MPLNNTVTPAAPAPPAPPVTIAVVGTGGSGGWFAQLTGKSNAAPGVNYILIDGDLWATSNLVRQFCTRRDLGKPKVESMSNILAATGAPVTKFPEFLAYQTPLYTTLYDIKDLLVLFVAVDNHPARKLCYQLADERNSDLIARETIVISVANEYETASAWAYIPVWANTPLDPRVRWPEIMTDDAGDPLRPSCTGEAAASSPQLALANMISATAGAWLLRFWTEIAPGFRNSMSKADFQTVIPTFPVLVDFTNGRQRTYTVGDIQREAEQVAQLDAAQQPK